MSRPTSILVVDDDADICSNVRDILEDLGYRTDIAHDGPSALRLIREKPFDIALLDFKMPGMDGAELYSEIRKLRPEIVAIMITAYAGSDGAERARAAGTWRVMRKPVDFASLLPLLEEAITVPIVLVVDDDPDYCDNIWQVLRDRNYRVKLARTEEEGIRAAGGKYDVAIVDLRLGSGDGQRVISMIRAAKPDAKIIVATGYPDLDDANNSIVLRKPIDVDHLLAELETR